MNYYERHLGDYARDTGHLSILEHGVYTLLLDRYYITESGIPETQVYRLARAKTQEERDAVDTVLADFFILKVIEKPDGLSIGSKTERLWVNVRAEEEIAKAQARINASKTNGLRGGRPPKPKEISLEKPGGVCLGSENETQLKAHQTPNPNLHTPGINTHLQTGSASGGFSPYDVCAILKQLGVLQTNPAHPDLITALGGGATKSDFEFAAVEAQSKGKGFAYLLKIVLGRIKDQKHAKTKQTNARECQVDTRFTEKYAGLC
ncbi:MAG: YdaU family protein [Methylomicrobium sp.]|nr:YdaU family protein [Methylomicrobium sp.]